MKFVSLSLLLLLSACSSAPEVTEEENAAKAAAEATEQCFANPELAKAWGECNVKKTIYGRMEGIGACQMKHGQNNAAMMLKISVRPNGRVKEVRAEDGAAKNRPLEKCLAAEISRLHFAAPPEGVKPVIYFPYQP